MRLKISAHVDGGLSVGLGVRRPGFLCLSILSWIDPISLVLSRTLFIVKSISNFKSRFSFLSSSICLFRSVQTIISENVDHVHYNHILKLKTHGQNNEDINFFLFFSDYQLILQKKSLSLHYF